MDLIDFFSSCVVSYNWVDIRRVLSFECGGFIFFYFCDIMELRSLTTVHYFGIISVFCNVRGVDAGAF